MAQTTYNYPYSAFGSALTPPSHKVDPDRLTLEIRTSAIITALDFITTNDLTSNCAIVFKDALSVGDQAILDTIVADHSGLPLPNNIPQPVQLYSGEGEPAPTASGVPVTLPNMFPIGVVLDLVGAADDAVAGRGEGAEFKLQGPANGADVSLEFQFNDWVTFAGGGMNYSGGLFGDNVDMSISAPATPVTPTPGTGNCNLIDPGIGAAILLVPAPGNGAFTVNLANAVPVPAPGNVGFYEWSEPDTGKGVVTVGAPGASTYNLFAAALPLSRYVTKMPLLDSRSVNLTIPAIKPTKVLPQWKSRVTLRTASQSQAKFTWYLVTARMKTTG